MNLPQNLFNGEVNVQFILCQPDKTPIGEIVAYERNCNFKFNTYSEISFSVDRYYNDLFDGEIKVNPYYDLVDSLRVIYLLGIGHFVIQDVEEDIGENETKTVTAFSLEYSTGQKYLENFYVNTGEEGSIETMYHAQKYGAEYAIDVYYEKATEWDEYGRYYIKEYTSNTAYNYVEKQVFNEEDFRTYNGSNTETTLYVKAYPNVRFYWPTKPELSLLHNVFSIIPEWKIGHVDKELWYEERTFSEDRTAAYDFLYNQAAETFKYVMEWNSITGEVSFYKTTEDGITADEKIETQWNTDVFISRENLASQLDISYSTDDIKTKLKITGADDLNVRDVNLGQNYILNLSFYTDPDKPTPWMSRELQARYNEYTKLLESKTEEYKKLISGWSATYNEYSDLMNHIPVDPKVLLVGDVFGQLYCTYGIRKATEYVEDAIYYDNNGGEITPVLNEDNTFNGVYYINKLSTQVENLQTKLKLYKVDRDKNGNISTIAKTDDVLLTLENSNKDSATIRVRLGTTDKKDQEVYYVWRIITYADTGLSETTTYTLTQWVRGDLSHSALGLSDNFKVKSIGTLGAYMCLMNDETIEANVEEYGIKLLEEKQNVYTQIFITQTEGYMSKDGAQCIASDNPPTEGMEIGDKWLDTDSDSAAIYEYDGTSKSNGYDGWKLLDPSNTEQNDYENYARFYENHKKLQNVQKVLFKKQQQADYLLNGVAVKDRYFADGISDSTKLLVIAANYFNVDQVTLTGYNANPSFITFTIDNDDREYAAYLNDGIPYISYNNSQGLYLVKMNAIKNETDMYNYFSDQELISLSPFIREDEYSDDNFLLTSYESEAEQMDIKQKLLDAGDDELKKICQPKLSFKATMANILSIPEFEPLKRQFRLGNFVRVGIRDGYVKRARLLEVQMGLDDKSDFSCVFGDLVSSKSEIDKHADLLKQSVTTAKSVASNSSNWQRGANKANAIDQAINDGLKDAALSVANSFGQNITWDQRGILGRKLVEGTEDTYSDEQFMLTNNKLVFTRDNWATSEAVVGEFTIDLDNGQQQTLYGLLAQSVVGGFIKGSEIIGGSLRIGKDGGSQFIVDEDGNVTIKAPDGKDKYASAEAISNIDAAYKYNIVLSYTGDAVFSSDTEETIIRATIYRRNDDATANFKKAGVSLNWNNSSNTAWEPVFVDSTYAIKIKSSDVKNSAQISCNMELTDEQIKNIEANYNDK